MTPNTLLQICEDTLSELRRLGLCNTIRDFSEEWLGSAPGYHGTAQFRGFMPTDGAWRLYVNLTDHGLRNLASKVHNAMMDQTRQSIDAKRDKRDSRNKQDH